MLREWWNRRSTLRRELKSNPPSSTMEIVVNIPPGCTHVTYKIGGGGGGNGGSGGSGGGGRHGPDLEESAFPEIDR